MAVAVSVEKGELRLGKPEALFTTGMFALTTEVSRQRDAVAPDGQRCLIDAVEGSAAAPITLILDRKPPRHP